MNKKSKIIVSVLSIFLVLCIAVSCWLYFCYESPEELAAKAQAASLSDRLSTAEGTITEYTALIAALREQLESAEADLKQKQEQISVLENKVSILLDEGTASDTYQQLLLDEIAVMKAEAEKTGEKIAELTELIYNYENITTLNFGYQAKKVSELLLKVADTNRPMRIRTTEEEDPETGEITVHEETLLSQVSFYYRDLGTGYTLSYESDHIMYAASLVKAPYIYSMLQTIADFEYDKRHFDAEGNPLYDAEGNPLFEGPHPNLDEEGNILYLEGEEKYNLSRIWTFDKEKMTVDGSGVIKKMDDGIQMTYLELVRHALQYSDNVAFAEIRKVFGYTEFYAMARTLGVRGTAKGYMQLSAEDCGKFMEAIYTFTEENETYGPFMKQALLDSSHTVMIPYALSPIPCAHKYGWDEDSYHDMAIVYDEHPYILVIMSDLDAGGTEENKYIRDIARSIHSIHKNFYSTK